MGDLTADVVGMTHQGNPTIISFGIGVADTFYKGALVFIDTGTGLAVTDGISDGDVFVGFAVENKVAAIGDFIEVAIDGVWTFTNSKMAIAESGENLIHDNSGDSNNPADLDSATGITEESGIDQFIGTILHTDGVTVTVNLNVIAQFVA